MPESKIRRLSWSRSAAVAYERTIAHIASEDEFTARKVVERVASSLASIEANPGIGTLLLNGRARRFPVARTGHSLNYVVDSDGIIIVRWYRQRQNVKR